MEECHFCAIVDGTEPSSIVHDSESVLSFMTQKPTRPGECLIIPKEHFDHFIDLDDETAAEMMRIAIRIGRNMMRVFHPIRVGVVIHGFGVSHVHLILLPQHDPNDITSARFASFEDGKIVFDQRNIPRLDRSVLDEHALKLRIESEA